MITKKKIGELARQLPNNLTKDRMIPEAYMNISMLKLTIKVDDTEGRKEVNVRFVYTDSPSHTITVNLIGAVEGLCTVELPLGMLYKQDTKGFKRLPYTQVEPVLHQLVVQKAQQIVTEINKQKSKRLEDIQRRKVPTLTDELRRRVIELRETHQIAQGYSDLFEGGVDITEYYGSLYISGTLKQDFNHLTKEEIYGFMVREDGVGSSFEVKEEDGVKKVRYVFEPF